MSHKDIGSGTLPSPCKVRCDTCHMFSIWAQSEKTFLPKFYIEKKWCMPLNISIAFLISKRASWNRNPPLILNIPLDGSLEIGLLRRTKTFVQVPAERKWHSWEIYQDLLQNIEERLLIQKLWHHLAQIVLPFPSSTWIMK